MLTVPGVLSMVANEGRGAEATMLYIAQEVFGLPEPPISFLHYGWCGLSHATKGMPKFGAH